jgi:hypothetical protein
MECILKNTYPVESGVQHVQVFHKTKCLPADMGTLFSETLCFLFSFFVCDIHWVRSEYHNEKKRGSVGFYTFTLAARAFQK